MKVVSVKDLQDNISKLYCEMGLISKKEVYEIIKKFKFDIDKPKEMWYNKYRN